MLLAVGAELRGPACTTATDELGRLVATQTPTASAMQVTGLLSKEVLKN